MIQRYWVRFDGVGETPIDAGSACDAAIEYVTAREARHVEFPIASGRETALVHVRADFSGNTYDIEVRGLARPAYEASIRRRSSPLGGTE
jgi:hypothetical protein